MKIIRLSLVLLCSASFLLTSCLGGDDRDLGYYEDTAITTFTLGTLKWNVDSVTASGKDTVYRKKLDAKKVVFYVDHNNKTVYNPDSLPYGVDEKKILCTVSSKNAGPVLIKSMTSDSLRYFNSKDSTDFSQPRKFRVYSNSQGQYREYTVMVNVHKEKPNVFKWKQVATSTLLGSLTAMRAVAANGRVFVFGEDGANTVICSAATNNGGTWTQLSPNVTLAFGAYKSICTYNNTLYILNNGSLLKSVDGVTWTSITSPGATVRQLVGVSGLGYHFLGTDGKLYLLKKNESAATADALDSDARLLPTNDINFLSMASTQGDSTDLLLLIGNRDSVLYTTDKQPTIWGKVAEYDAYAAPQAWAYYAIASNNRYPLPRIFNLQAVVYDRGILAIGGNGIGTDKTKAFSQMYFSKDGGITWHSHPLYKLPKEWSSSATSFAMTVDADNYIWLIGGTSGQVWKARKNSLGWKKVQTEFVK
ncbi:DUF6242 domain-containing protein [Hoylesella saccharolytica]|uniref:DUF6242 domain-containing protein n=1 Tax=Hoylesella saccharolytica TaxID=633701 RepID=UPI00046FB658|nr:DUF6242 domain-containing protein [Hoylesella saccharolytica]